jgi:hypothetical protein
VKRRARKTRKRAWVDFIGLVVGWVDGMVLDISSCRKNEKNDIVNRIRNK